MLATKTANILYSAFKNAIAPSAILSAIRFMRTVPESWRATQEDLQAVKSNAIIPNTGIMQISWLADSLNIQNRMWVEFLHRQYISYTVVINILPIKVD